MRSLPALAAVFCVLSVDAAVPSGEYAAAKKKFEAISDAKTKPGSRIPLTSRELNAYVKAELPSVAPDGVREPRVELHGNNTASGSVLVDFLKLRVAQGKPPGWMLRQLLRGEREVKVLAAVQSSRGTATVTLKRVEVAGVPLDGAALDFLLKNYFLPNYPAAKIGKPFALKHRVDRVEVKPNVAYVFLKR